MQFSGKIKNGIGTRYAAALQFLFPSADEVYFSSMGVFRFEKFGSSRWNLLNSVVESIQKYVFFVVLSYSRHEKTRPL